MAGEVRTLWKVVRATKVDVSYRSSECRAYGRPLCTEFLHCKLCTGGSITKESDGNSMESSGTSSAGDPAVGVTSTVSSGVTGSIRLELPATLPEVVVVEMWRLCL